MLNRLIVVHEGVKDVAAFSMLPQIFAKVFLGLVKSIAVDNDVLVPDVLKGLLLVQDNASGDANVRGARCDYYVGIPLPARVSISSVLLEATWEYLTWRRHSMNLKTSRTVRMSAK